MESHYALFFDTETTTDPSQALTFGTFRYCYIHADGDISTLTEGLIYADDLPGRNPDGYAALRTYADGHTPEIDWRFTDREPNPVFEILSRHEFTKRWLWLVGHQHQELVVGFNLPFDLTRISTEAYEARGDYTGGFSLVLFTHPDGNENTYRPRLRVRIVNSKAAFISYAKNNNHAKYPGRFLDTRTLAFALTNQSYSLEGACAAFNVEHGKYQAGEHGVITDEYIEYCRRDVLATAELYTALVYEYDKHELDMPPEKIYSPASVAKAYLKKMNIPRPLERDQLAPEILGYATSAYYGARAECRIRRLDLPIVQLDFTSMYPTVNTLLGLWDVLTCENVDIVDATDDVQKLLESVTLGECFNTAIWRRFMGIAKITPNEDILPARARYNGRTWSIGVNYTLSDDEYWYAIPDLIASVLLSGRVPKVCQALMFVPRGTATGLRTVSLRGSVEVDPTSGDFFREIVQERVLHKGTPLGDFLKVLVNSGCYGIYGEVNEQKGRKTVSVAYSNRPLGPNKTNSEVPGIYAYPPIASVITASARLMLAMLERCVTDSGGNYVFTDTDSMSIVACDSATTVHGIRTLTLDDVTSIQNHFNSLNPYSNVADLLKREYTGWCWAISAKRYALFHRDEQGNVVIDKNSEHGLGHLVNPTDPDSEDRRWITQLWQYLISTELGLNVPEPPWLDRPALSRYAVTQTSLLHSFRALNAGKNYAEQVKPASFMLIAHATKTQLSYQRKTVPIASYTPNATQWLNLHWIDRRNPGNTFRVSTLGEWTALEPGIVYVRGYRDVLESYRTHVEAKFKQMDGRSCQPTYRGVLRRRHMRGTGTVYMGSESQQLELVEHNLADASEVTQQRKVEDWYRTLELLKPILSRFSLSELHRLTHIPRSTLGHIMSGARKPWLHYIRTMVDLACRVASDDLGARYIPGKTDVRELLTRWRDTNRSRHHGKAPEDER